jgi:hypothetical protein
MDEPSPNTSSRPAQHVDEAGRDNEPGRIDRRLRWGAVERADGGDAIAQDSHISGPGGRSGAVDDAAVADDQVVFRRTAAGRERKNEKRGD